VAYFFESPCTTSPGHDSTCKISGATSTWVAGQIATLTHESFCPFHFVSLPHPQLLTSSDTPPSTIHHHNRSAILGVRKMKYEILPLFA